MANRFSPDELAALPVVLSPPRYTTYARQCGNDPRAALTLYHWNAQISASFLFPLHIFEICVRNAAANAIESYYRSQWPWSQAFQNSLPNPTQGFSPRQELQRVIRSHTTTGKVIADLKFAFWVSIFTARHDGRLWNTFALREFPHFPPGTQASAARSKIYHAADNLRELRNRIAHHEPIFRRDLIKDYTVMHEIINYKCPHTAAWMHRSQQVSNLLMLRP